MLVRLCNHLLLVLLPILTLFIGGLKAVAPGRVGDDYLADLRTFLGMTECAGSTVACWQGLRVGQTDYGAARMYLKAHPWVASVNEPGARVLLWYWDDDGPDFLLPGGRSEIRFSADGLIEEINLNYLTIDLGALAALSGEFDLYGGYPNPFGVIEPYVPDYSMSYSLYAPRLRLFAGFRLDCPLNTYRFWSGEIRLLVFKQQPLPRNPLEWPDLYQRPGCGPNYFMP